MKLYSALVKQDQQDGLFDLVLVKEGFHFSAFFFGIFWLCYHRIWFALAAQAAVGALIYSCCSFGYISSLQSLILDATMLAMIASNADRLLEYSYKKRGYEFVAMIVGNDELEARARLLQGN